MQDNRTIIPKSWEDLSPIHKDLIESLDYYFKVEVRPTHDLRTYDRMVGQQEVIAHIKFIYKNQNKLKAVT